MLVLPLSHSLQVSEEEGFIAIIPQGYESSWNGTHAAHPLACPSRRPERLTSHACACVGHVEGGECCGAARTQDIDDVG